MRISDWSSDVCSSDLLQVAFTIHRGRPFRPIPLPRPSCRIGVLLCQYSMAAVGPSPHDGDRNITPAPATPRSEEHTSELQSLMRLSYAVFCLKKQIYSRPIHTNTRTIAHYVNRYTPYHNNSHLTSYIY